MIQCRKKRCDIKDESKVELHHLVPKFMGGSDRDGRKYLCKKHHNILGLIIPKIIFKYIPKEKKEEVRQDIKSFTLWWLEK